MAVLVFTAKRGYAASGHQSVGVDLLDGLADICPEAQACEDIHDTALVVEGRLLQHAEILHEPVEHDILHHLVHKVNLAAVQLVGIQEAGKGCLGGGHIQPHNLAHEFSQRLLGKFLLISILRADFLPEYALQFLQVLGGEGNVPLQFADDAAILVLLQKTFRFAPVGFQHVVAGQGLADSGGDNLVPEVRIVASALVGQVLHQVAQTFADMLELVHPGICQVAGV